MAISKVVYEDENGNSSVWMNVTDDTVDSDLLVDGIQATKADGEKVQGEIPIMSSSDLMTSGATVVVPSGYYDVGASKSVNSGTATTPATSITANPSISVNSSTGVITATTSASQNITPTVSAGYVSVGTAGTVSVTGSNTSQLTTQSAKTVTPTESEQTAVASGRYTTGAVKVGAISSTYVGSGITQRDSSDLTASGATITAPAGYYSSSASKSVSTTTHPNPTASINSSTGLVTASHTQGTGYVTGGTTTGTLQLSTQSATTITPTTSSQVAVPASTFTTGAVTVGAIPSQYIVPSGTLSIASNGAFDVASYASVNVEVSGGDELEQLITRQISGVYSNNTINYIGAYAFGHCRITEASFPAVSQIGTSAFASCPYMTTINFPSLTKIGDYAFNYCSVLTTINAPNVTSIGSSAFIRCSTLTTASFSLATDIGEWAFGYCYSLTEANLPVASRITGYTFYSCSMLTSVNVPLASYVWYSAFQYCSMLRKISLPVATNIGSNAFAFCSNLTSVILPIARSIGNSAFAYCTKSLTAISFPSVVSIGASAFLRCYNLATVTLPSASYIGSYAFASCSNLLSMVLLGSSVASLANWNAFMFTPISNSTTSTGGVHGSIYVPLSLYNSYITATFWSTYSARIVGVEREFNEILTLPLSTGSEFNGLEYYLQTTGTAGILTEGETYHLEGTIIVNGTEYELDPSTTEFVAASGGTIAEVVCGNITLNFTLQSDIGHIDIWTTSGASITLQGKTTIFGENAIAIVHNWHV